MTLPDLLTFQAYFNDMAEKNGVASYLTEQRIRLFYRLTEHMLTINEQFNLTAITDWKRVILLHYIDCLVGASCFPEGASVIDVGCGAGFPSLPLAICRPDLKITSLDSTAKRVHYVADTAKMLGVSLTPLVARAEDAATAPLRASFDCATARAVAALPVLAELCMPFVKVGGLFAPMKGKGAAEERAAAEHAIRTLGGRFEEIRETPLVDELGEAYAHTTLLIRQERPTPKEYPRPYAKIVKRPL